MTIHPSTIDRSSELVRHGYPLDRTTGFVRFSVPEGAALTVGAEPDGNIGGWAATVLYVKAVKGSREVDFSSPKTLGPGASSVSCSEADMAGVAAIEVGYSSGGASAAGTSCSLMVRLERHVQPAAVLASPSGASSGGQAEPIA